MDESAFTLPARQCMRATAPGGAGPGLALGAAHGRRRISRGGLSRRPSRRVGRFPSWSPLGRSARRTPPGRGRLRPGGDNSRKGAGGDTHRRCAVHATRPSARFRSAPFMGSGRPAARRPGRVRAPRAGRAPTSPTPRHRYESGDPPHRRTARSRRRRPRAAGCVSPTPLTAPQGTTLRILARMAARAGTTPEVIVGDLARALALLDMPIAPAWNCGA
jgi:hypothetical protein